MFICEKCLYEGHRRTLTPGSKSMEMFLWLVFLIPGPIYSAWRVYGRQHFCPNCKAEGTMRRTWLSTGKMLKWEAEDKLIEEIQEMEARKRAEREAAAGATHE